MSNKTLVVALVLVFASAICRGQDATKVQRYVAITFDDLPVVCRCKDDAERRYITDKLIATFKQFKMPILGVVNEQKLETDGVVDSTKVALLRRWLHSGFELGNHGYSHRNINDISMEEYEQEILRGEKITRVLAKTTGMPYRFFRHPFLSAGDDLNVRRQLDDILLKHHYRIAPNTITYQDYTFSGAYETALQHSDSALAKKIRDAYLPYTLSRWEAAEQQSRDLFGREIKQILMVHANRLNADAFGDVARMMKERGYTFISIDAALEDPAYSRPDTFDGKVGVTWLARWAAEMGIKKNYGTNQVPQFILDVNATK
jgi:peptidoglycan/xylan/chitin deacetylase (PgdA/CDA1 family)